jgi:hypothetical protein
MDLDRLFRNPEVGGNLLVEPSDHDVLQHLMFARRERGQAPPERIESPPHHARMLIPGQRIVDRGQKVVVPERLEQEIDRSRSDRMDSGGDVAAPGHENDAALAVGLQQRLLEGQPAQARQTQVEHRAARRQRIMGEQEFLGRRKRFHSHRLGRQQAAQCPQHSRVAIDQVHDRPGRLGVQDRPAAQGRAGRHSA